MRGVARHFTGVWDRLEANWPLFALTLEGTEGADRLVSGVEADLLSGFGGDDVLLGRDGDDTLDGGLGTDRMAGGAGNDVYYVDLLGDVVTELAGGGVDTVMTGVGFYVLAAHVENLDGSIAGASSRFLIGNDLDNVITAGGGHDNLAGAAGSDTLRGGLGDDFYRVEDAGDVVVEARDAGRDTVLTDLAVYRMAANVEAVVVMGGQGQKVIGNGLDNLVTGSSGDETLLGGRGDDTLFGQVGKDVVTGGDGADMFDLATASVAGEVTRITDFDAGQGDLIGLRLFSGGSFAAFGLGALDASVFKSYSSLDQIDQDDRILYDQATGRLYFDRDGSGVLGATEIALVANQAVLTADSFWVHI